MKPILRSDNPECDWTEDFEHENGNYQCHCFKCDRYFTGHKRRIVCKVCSEVAHTEKDTFLQYVKNEREAITAELYSDWLQKLPKERVAIENLLIAYDQMVERLRTPSPSGGIKTATPFYEILNEKLRPLGKSVHSFDLPTWNAILNSADEFHNQFAGDGWKPILTELMECFVENPEKPGKYYSKSHPSDDLINRIKALL